MCYNTSSDGKVIRSSLETFGGSTRSVESELGIESGEVVEDIHEFVFEIVSYHRSFGIVSKGRIPSEFGTNLICQLLSPAKELHLRQWETFPQPKPVAPHTLEASLSHSDGLLVR